MDNKGKNKIIIISIVLLILLILILFLLFRNNKKYEVEFDAKQGDIVEVIKVNKDSKVKRPKDPEREGYKFVGWYYKDKIFDFTTPITKNMILEARWEKASEDNSINIEINKTQIELNVGDSYKIDAKTSDNSKLSWESSDTSVVNVSNDGVIKAIKNGTAEIKAKAKDGTSVTITVKVIKKDDKTASSSNKTNNNNNKGNNSNNSNNTNKTISVTGVNLNNTSLSLFVGNSSKLVATVNPSNASNKDVSWSSNDSSVVTVDSNGNIKGIKPGTAVIVVTTKDGSHQASCTVVVKEVPAEYKVIIAPIAQEAIDIMQYSVTITKNGSTCSDCEFILYDGVKRVSTIPASQYNKNIQTAKVRLSNGNFETADIIYR